MPPNLVGGLFNGATPRFAMEGGWLLALCRAGWLIGAFAAAGGLLFRAAIAPRAMAALPPPVAARVERATRLLAWCGFAAALAGAGAWAAATTAYFTDRMPPTASDVADVLTKTRFGHLVLSQTGLVALAALFAAARRRENVAMARWGGLVAMGVAIAAQAWHGHAAGMGNAALLAAGVAHVLGAAGWLGTLPALLLFVATAPAAAAAQAARDYGTVGRLCLAAIVASAAIQGVGLIGGVPALFGTAHGVVSLIKLGLLSLLTGFALANRHRLAPALRGPTPRGARTRLLVSLAAQTAAGVSVVLAATVLTSLTPGVHAQPVWPFAWRASLEAVREDSDLAREALLSAVAFAVAIGSLVVAATVRGRTRWGALIVAGLLAWRAAQNLDVLVVETGPTFYQRSPSGFAALSVARGATLYAGLCVTCHGASGHGDGPAAATLAEPPADLTAPHLSRHSDGELFGWLRDGMRAPDGRLAMPGFSAPGDDDLWALIDFVRANNAGLGRAAGDGPRVMAPDFSATRADGQDVALSELRGQFVEIGFGPVPGATSLSVIGGARTAACETSDEAVWTAYAIVLGIPSTDLAGTRLVIDPAGWVRAIEPPGDPARWDDPAVLAAVVAGLRSHPVDRDAPPMPPMNM